MCRDRNHGTEKDPKKDSSYEGKDMRNLIILLSMAMVGCSTPPGFDDVPERRMFSLGASYSQLEAGDSEIASGSGAFMVSKTFEGGLEVGGSVTGIRWEVGSNDSTVIRPEGFLNYNVRVGGLELYAGPHAGWAHFVEDGTDDGLSYGGHVGIRLWSDDNVSLFIQPQWTRYSVFGERVNDKQVIVGVGIRF